ncbi:MAG: hypothetical protein ABJD13_04475 [Paracoccaceae bacterium]
MRRHLGRMFPVWRNAGEEGYWSGTISAARNQIRFLGELPRHIRILAAHCFIETVLPWAVMPGTC